MISSAVIVPESDDLSPTSPPQKRRTSSVSYEQASKRPRLASQVSGDSNGYAIPPSATSPLRRKPSVASSGAAEERKRGQRLFGALLGTLSQSSTTTAQKRRADIEKKQLGKLQQRDEALEEEKRRKREETDAIRQKEQRIWDEHSVSRYHRAKWTLLTKMAASNTTQEHAG
jgi:pinin/SDK/memA/ protein conserved region